MFVSPQVCAVSMCCVFHIFGFLISYVILLCRVSGQLFVQTVNTFLRIDFAFDLICL